MSLGQASSIVVAGDVDAGKSTLIARLLQETGSLSVGVSESVRKACDNLGRGFEYAYFLDSFEEERLTERTIDTTQAICRLPRGNFCVFVDVPGHQEFVQAMLSGASYADSALLVIDANQPITQQTKRHALLLEFIGIPQIIVCINKLDLCGFKQAAFER